MPKRARIISDPRILGGKPVIEGTRLSVELILEELQNGATYESLLARYPTLTPAGLDAAFRYLYELLKEKTTPPQSVTA